MSSSLDPACSVVLASCQGGRFIGAQLESIVSQLGIGDEVIVSDDASTDNTLELVSGREDPRIRILRNSERVGYVRNFERAVAAARGELVFFSDQDDVWLPGKVDQLRRALMERPCVASDAVVVDEHLQELHPSYFRLHGTRGFSSLSIIFRPPIIGATLAIRSTYLRTLLPFPAEIPHDFWLSFNAAWDGALKVVESPLILYRRHSGAHSPTAMGRRRSLTRAGIERARLLREMVRRRLGPVQVERSPPPPTAHGGNREP